VQTGVRGTTGRTSELDYGPPAGVDYGEESFNRGLGYGAATGTALRTSRETAQREGRRSRWQREPLSAGEIMTKNPKAVLPNSTIREVAQIMRDESTGVVPVVDENNRLQGIITDRDIVMRSIPEGKDPINMRASELMTDDVEAVTPNESLHDVVRLMGDKQIRRVPVVDQNDRLVGIISMADIATRADYDEDLQEALEDISARRSFWSKLFG
jgi:CBS domain-containing protein